MVGRNKAIFLDRDGVINKEVNYLSDPSEFNLIKGVAHALKSLKAKGYLLIVITNQSGIARGYYNEETLQKIHDKMNSELEERGVKLDDIYFCPHHPEFTGLCPCRKPKPGMLLRAKKDHEIDLESSYLVGDKLSDIKAGLNAHCQTVLVLSGHGNEEIEKIQSERPDMICKDLLEFSKNI